MYSFVCEILFTPKNYNAKALLWGQHVFQPPLTPYAASFLALNFFPIKNDVLMLQNAFLTLKLIAGLQKISFSRSTPSLASTAPLGVSTVRNSPLAPSVPSSRALPMPPSQTASTQTSGGPPALPPKPTSNQFRPELFVFIKLYYFLFDSSLTRLWRSDHEEERVQILRRISSLLSIVDQPQCFKRIDPQNYLLEFKRWRYRRLPRPVRNPRLLPLLLAFHLGKINYKKLSISLNHTTNQLTCRNSLGCPRRFPPAECVVLFRRHI